MQLYRYLEVEEKNKFNSKSTDVKTARIQQEYSIPFEYTKLQLCKLFNCLPSQLENENFEELMMLMAVDNAINQYQNWVNSTEKLAIPLKLHLEILKLERHL